MITVYEKVTYGFQGYKDNVTGRALLGKEVSFVRLGSGLETVKFNPGLAAEEVAALQVRSSCRWRLAV